MKWVLALGAAGALSGCADTSGESKLQTIVFASERDGDINLYMAREDGAELKRLTSDAADDLVPRCSPDGRQVVFLRGTFNAGDIYRLNLEDSAESPLTTDAARNSTPQWSRDGDLVYFTKRDGEFDRIAVMHADGSDVRFLTDGKAHDTMPGVSPDGKHLVHHTYRYGKETELHLIDIATGESGRLTNAPGSDYEASFAGPDEVVFSSDRDGGHYRIYAASIATGETRLLADTGEDAWAPRYSPVSRDVLFNTGKMGAWRLLRVPLAGGDAMPVLADGHSNLSGDWCPLG